MIYAELQGQYFLGFAGFLFLVCTNLLDGRIARKYGWVSPFGETLDTVCDKLFAFIFFCLLHISGSCPEWFLGFYVAILILQGTGWGLLALSEKSETPLHPLKAGKFNTALQFVWIGSLLMDIALRHQFPRNFLYSEVFHNVGYLILVGSQISVFFQYFLVYRNELLPDSLSLFPSDIDSMHHST